MRNELVADGVGLSVSGGEVGHKHFSSGTVEVVFKRLELLPEGRDVVKWDLDGAGVELAEGVHFFCSSRVVVACVGGRIREEWRTES